MEPIVDELEDEYRGDFDFVHIDIDTSRGKDLAREHAFVGQPTFLLFNDAGEEVRRLSGPQAKETLTLEIDRILGR